MRSFLSFLSKWLMAGLMTCGFYTINSNADSNVTLAQSENPIVAASSQKNKKAPPKKAKRKAKPKATPAPTPAPEPEEDMGDDSMGSDDSDMGE